MFELLLICLGVCSEPQIVVKIFTDQAACFHAERTWTHDRDHIYWCVPHELTVKPATEPK